MENKQRKLSTGSAATSGYQTGSQPGSTNNTITPDNSQEIVLPRGPTHKRPSRGGLNPIQESEVWHIDFSNPTTEPNVPNTLADVDFVESIDPDSDVNSPAPQSTDDRTEDRYLVRIPQELTQAPKAPSLARSGNDESDVFVSSLSGNCYFLF